MFKLNEKRSLKRKCVDVTFAAPPPPKKLKFADVIARHVPAAFANTKELTDIWNILCEKDIDDNMLVKRINASPDWGIRRRHSELLNWLFVISNRFKLLRSTYHLAGQYFFRFVASKDHQKHQQQSSLNNVVVYTAKTNANWQLIAITCLFIAAKVEEVYAPSVYTFADATAADAVVSATSGANTSNQQRNCRRRRRRHQQDYNKYSASDIIHCERMILIALDWKAISFTAIDWLALYMQLAIPDNILTDCSALMFERREFSRLDYVRAANVLDLCSMDHKFTRFSNGLIAASAYASIHRNISLAMMVSGFDQQIIEQCVCWMEEFNVVIERNWRNDSVVLLEPDDHLLQTSIASLPLDNWTIGQLPLTCYMQ